MKIGIITQYYAPEPIRIATQVAEELSKRGHEVWVETGFPNYPGGKLYPGFRQKRAHVEVTNGVHVHRVPMYINHSQAALLRMLNYGSFALSSFFKGNRLLHDTDVIYVYATQMTPALGPDIWHSVRKKPYVMHIQDLWPESITGSTLLNPKLQALIAAVLSPWLRRLYRRASATIAIAPTMAKILQARGVNPNKLHTVFNWTNEHDPEVHKHVGDTPIIPRHSGITNFVYAGNFGDMQDLATVVRGAAYLQHRPEFQLYLVGSGVQEEQLRRLVQDLKLKNVTILGRVPTEKMWQVNEGADFQLVSLKNLDIFRGTIPSKFQNALRSGTPVVSNVAGDVAALIQENNLGLVA